jgi:hypothetical protein
MTEVIDDADRLGARVQATRCALARRTKVDPAGIDIRVVASVVHLGLVARLIAASVGATAVAGAQISLAAEDLWWQDLLGGPFPLSVTTASTGATSFPGTAVVAITAAVADRYRVSDRVLWGNVGSAANSAARLIAASRPSLAGAADGAADRFLADPRVEGGVLHAGPDFRRRSCCLIYRLAATTDAVCGDCVLTSRHGDGVVPTRF